MCSTHSWCKGKENKKTKKKKKQGNANERRFQEVRLIVRRVVVFIALWLLTIVTESAGSLSFFRCPLFVFSFTQFERSTMNMNFD